MIVRIQRGGKSFKWLGKYLTHDAGKASTSERVAWTETLNLANDHIPTAIDEMYWTYRAADQLKRAAGIGTGGTRLQSPVKHVSLNWHPSDQPSREDMVEAVREFMQYMGWQDRQAVLVAHNDRPHKHVHVMINTVSPIDGRGLNAGYEWNRAERWRENYDRVRFQNRCEQDLKPYEQRENAPTRESWLKFKPAEQEFERDEAARRVRAPDYFDRHDPAHWKAKEWKALHASQKDERTAFFDGGKQAYREVRNHVFREVRTEFSDQWKTYFELRRDGTDLDLLAAIKAGILERQNAELEKRRDEACKELRERRDKEYEAILQQQRDERAELKDRQHEGLRTFALLDGGEESTQAGPLHRDADNLKEGFGSAARETTQPKEREREERHEREFAFDEAPRPETFKVRDGFDAAGSLGLGALGAIANIGERLFDGFFGGVPKQPAKQQDNRSRPEARQHDARRAERQQRTEDKLAEEAAKLHAFWEDRRRTRSRDRD
jgi:hypothetical protein